MKFLIVLFLSSLIGNFMLFDLNGVSSLWETFKDAPFTTIFICFINPFGYMIGMVALMVFYGIISFLFLIIEGIVNSVTKKYLEYEIHWVEKIHAYIWNDPSFLDSDTTNEIISTNVTDDGSKPKPIKLEANKPLSIKRDHNNSSKKSLTPKKNIESKHAIDTDPENEIKNERYWEFNNHSEINNNSDTKSHTGGQGHAEKAHTENYIQQN